MGHKHKQSEPYVLDFRYTLLPEISEKSCRDHRHRRSWLTTTTERVDSIEDQPRLYKLKIWGILDLVGLPDVPHYIRQLIAQPSKQANAVKLDAMFRLPKTKDNICERTL
ncbi:Hypothetical predicted protein [Pelobates cultripes]|uniref:Uncharacterized protein n=1 Tax=Pelobates cultripes TaxID=61616 RepID=A0AAD1TCA7_PELCU|nr:Hypothetical predicted protein [Pelobates cultripes]